MMNEYDARSPLETSPLRRLGVLLAIAIVAGFIADVTAHGQGAPAAVGIGTLIFLASFAVGSFFGFLFGVPRVPTDEPPQLKPAAQPLPGARAPAAPDGDAKAATQLRLLRSNTNLERISDWLTTMLVGATLVQLHKINDALLDFRTFLASTATVFQSASGPPNAGVLPAVGPILLVFGVTCGFLFMYLNTRLVLVLLFYAVEGVISGGSRLPANKERAVRSFVQGAANVGSFVQNLISEKRQLTVEDALNLMFDLLYKENPDQVIELGAQLSGTAAIKKADYWFYLAAAFGQKMKAFPRESDEWNSNKDNALDSASRAVAIDGAYRDALWSISDPKGPDDDLSELRDNDEFLRIVGRKQSGR